MHPTAETIEFTDAELIVSLTDGRTIIVPIAWFSRLSHSTKEQLENFELLGDGEGIHWPQIDEDLSVKGLLLGFH
ncbi:MAG: DUF2442 domain-containing protein [Pseudomonadota bacterium]